MRELTRFARRRLELMHPYLTLDAGYEKVRIDGERSHSQAVMIALGGQLGRPAGRCWRWS